MNKYLRLFHFSKNEADVAVESGIIFDNQYENFSDISRDIDNRVLSCRDDRNVKNFRFKRPTLELVTNVSEIFDSQETFETRSQFIAEKFKEAIQRRFHKDFYLVVFATRIADEDLLFIAKMETNTALQVTDQNTLKTLRDVLPDSKSRLHKAVVIYKESTVRYKEGREEEGQERSNIHSKVLDRSDDNISEYFLGKFLESDPIIDNPEAAAQIAFENIALVTKPYIKTDREPDSVEKKLKYFLSEERQTSFEGLIHEVQDLLDFANADRPTDAEALAKQAYDNAKSKNNTVVQEFRAKLKRPPKKTFISSDDYGDRKFKVSYYESLEEADIIIWEEIEEYKILKIHKDLLPIEEKGHSNAE
ncbi:hypothetical protein ACVR05_06790 [Streptococcus caprae]|uniref:Nucleoid-associated protein n=1 Tax=Streptococcus caprae TaxID=1640501 RepID=A0ABV8CW95_9STRE